MRERGGVDGRIAAAYDGVPVDALSARIGVRHVEVFDVVGSTMDVAHALAAGGAPDGTLVLADMQVAGRGRQGRRWLSEAGRGIWLTLVSRPRNAAGIEVLSLRAGLALAEAVAPLVDPPVRLKWPNDVYAAGGKLAGILVEARWRDARPDWVAIGVGLNVKHPGAAAAGALREGTSRVEALARIVPALLGATKAEGGLTPAELARYAARDLAVGRSVVSPGTGVVRGIDSSGSIVIVGPDGPHAFRSGSLVFGQDQEQA